MHSRRASLWKLLALALSSPLFAGTEIPQLVPVCGDDSEWPPYTFYARHNGQKTTPTGFNVDLLNAILAPTGRRADVQLLPWKRCLNETEHGRFAIALDGVKAPERTQVFLFPPSHYTTNTTYLYNKAKPLPALNSLDDLVQLTACGQIGYIYELPNHTRIPISASARSFAAVMKMLERGRCEVVFADLKIVHGYRLIGHYDAFASGNIAAMTAPSWGAPLHRFFYDGQPGR